MINTDAVTLQKNFDSVVDNALEYDETINISTQKGNLIMLNEQDYNNLIATLEIMSNKPLFEDIKGAMSEPLSESTPASEINW